MAIKRTAATVKCAAIFVCREHFVLFTSRSDGDGETELTGCRTAGTLDRPVFCTNRGEIAFTMTSLRKESPPLLVWKVDEDEIIRKTDGLI